MSFPLSAGKKLINGEVADGEMIGMPLGHVTDSATATTPGLIIGPTMATTPSISTSFLAALTPAIGEVSVSS